MKQFLLGFVLLVLVVATTLNTLVAIDNGDYKASIDKHFKKDDAIEKEEQKPETPKEEATTPTVDVENGTITIVKEA